MNNVKPLLTDRQPFVPLRSLAVCLFLFFLFGITAQAHRILFETSQHPPAATVSAFFSRASPLADAAVTIMAPGSDQPWQTGRTDKTGNFAFLPDQPGEWIVRVDDERGHQGRTSVSITEAFFKTSQHPEIDSSTEVATEELHHAQDTKPDNFEASELPTIYRIILGIAIIFGITGIFYGWKARQKLKHATSSH